MVLYRGLLLESQLAMGVGPAISVSVVILMAVVV
jgi:hypothetical protein